MKKYIQLVFFIFIIPSVSFAQEICNDGIDNDGDGFVDCFDGDCTDTADCDGFFLGNDASCEAEPLGFPRFVLERGYTSPRNVVNNLNQLVVGDLDRDGIPEIVTNNAYTDRVYILNGDDATIKHQATINYPTFRGAAIANIEDDNCAEVFFIYYNGSSGRYRIVAYDCELNFLWESENLRNDPVLLSFADFDRDGQAEMYYKDEIRDALTGTRIVETTTANWERINSGAVAVDMLGNEDLELVIGDKIYGVNLGNRSQDAGNLTLLASMPTSMFNYRVKNNNQEYSATTSVADYNLDGNLDVIFTGATNGTPTTNVTSAFFWDVANDTVAIFNDPRGGGNYSAGWYNGMGRINIADLDGDGQLNAAFVSGRYLYALDENWEILWEDEFGNPGPKTVNEETSGITGCTLFDFNGDGQSEVVYRDEDFVYIINGFDGSINTQVPCRSRTNVEYPVVADVNADGSTEICVVCTPENYRAGDFGRQLPISGDAEVRVYVSGGEPWVPARRVWNQHGYFNVNINDDLTVPQNQQKHQAVFSTGVCTTGPSRPLNSFLNQSPFLSSDGCPTYASPDLNILESTLTINAPECPEQDFTISFDLENIGDVPLTGWVPITFYDGDPLVAGANRLNTDSISLTNFTPGSVASSPTLTVNGTGGNFTLYVSLNDDGENTIPLEFPASNFLECDYFNNIVSAEINPIPFALSSVVTKNIDCSSGGVPANGSARVFKLEGTTEVTANYDFFWFDGTSVTGTPDYIGSTYSGLSAGTYTVFANNTLVGCTSDTIQVVIEDSARNVTADITVDRGNSNCKTPNGKLTVSINGGQPVGNFEYEWYEGNTVGGGLQISNSHVATGLESAAYTVLVTEKATGCQTIESINVPDETNPPVATASATDIVCSDTNSGVVTASVGGSTAGYTFEWFIGPSEKPTPDYTGATVNNLPQGTYSVIVTDNSSDCPSQLVTVEVNQTQSPEIDAISSTENNSCDTSNPNGSVTVSIVGNVADHTIEWFAGAGTTGATVGTGTSVSGLGGGEYTARVTNNDTGCSATERVTINNNIIIPNLSATTDPVTNCDPFNGRIEATVDLDTEADYTFFWYEGNSVTASSLIDETVGVNVLDGLTPGFYTIQALNNNRSCLTDPITVEVIDNATVNISQNTTRVQPATACDLDNGELEVEISSPGNTQGFDVDWYEGSNASGTAFLTEEGVTQSVATGLFTGLYTVVATDLNTGCSSQRILNLPFIGAHELDSVEVINTTTCNPFDGSIEVLLTEAAGTDKDDYSFTITKENEAGDYDPVNIASHPTAGVIGQNNYIFGELDEGNYIIEAINDLTGCSVFYTETVGRNSVDPTFSIEERIPNTNCEASFANGSLELNIDNGANPNDYNIFWYEGTDTSTPLGTNIGTTAGINGEIATGLIGGNYTVEVINDFTKCSTIRTFSLVDNPTIVSIPASEIEIDPITLCDTNNSRVVINNIFENSVVGDLNDYNFEWFDSDMTLISTARDSISGLDSGTYFLQATSTVSGCATSLIEFEIERDITEPIITLDFANPEQCVDPSLGFLTVNASGPGASFSYAWYNGQSASGTVAQNGPDYFDLTEGFYTVEVFDSLTNCSYVETYELVTEINPVNLSISATPVTNCDAPNGSVFATVTSNGSAVYDYEWTDANGNIVGTTKEIDSLAVGEYTVTAIDVDDPSCQNTATITVEDQRIIPEITMEEIAPLTVCDLSRANGAARASINGEFIGYTFEWFEGSSASGNVLYVGPDFSGLEAITYTVRVTDNITQCSNEASITISSDIPEVDRPTIEVIANDTDCQIDNGVLRVDVNGNISNYEFNWYEGDEGRGTVIGTGDRISDLAAGEYSVTATDLRTGCTSEAVSAEIEEILVFPILETETIAANCNQENGSASVFVSGEAEIKNITWYTEFGNLVARGPVLDGVSSGNYFVSVESLRGCITEANVTIPTSINAFNGISRNGDGANSFFKIECIENYPDNLVKIYNRAGTLVYEAVGYDNNTVKFDGVSNRGINILGEDLPDGTYFYVIDKKDGSKPENGYLEIVN
ncbi:gliding motility-associated C-terminal domain-containing protein [Marivirga arenosa]|uniref:Gliding motility-associated C-terminal domain-containing protein n=1 Tax=Marivirga arenosa TaxID=3059076 RepID=A0AA51N7U8_9BACT|nr:gliding motility-associated C-terminal domain-containing protein [Marivirga sp. ABR2-2]WMN06136.1 gliding motility-associated C-terminal domain-containing protein [Marivirga sp. ABR2-2]